ncbi:hypothetical protein JHK85_031896 [Glycine max]|nr:hypothetical protein JHK85_031896 [Glycine max]KHN38668.1 hypothetical protein glysoja_008217 [Glycine soja]
MGVGVGLNLRHAQDSLSCSISSKSLTNQPIYKPFNPSLSSLSSSKRRNTKFQSTEKAEPQSANSSSTRTNRQLKSPFQP